MATRALIGYLDTDGNLKLTSTYNNYDGYPGNLGKGLETFYNNDLKAEEIANVGYISFLDSETGKWDAKNKKPPIKKNLTDNFNEAMFEIAEAIDRMGGDYGYIWDNENEEWITIRNYGIGSMKKDLEIALSHLRGKFGTSPDQIREVKDTKSEIISKLSQFFDVPASALSKFNFDGKDPIQALTKALNGTDYEGVENIVRVAIKAAKRDSGIDESFVHQMKYKAGIIK